MYCGFRYFKRKMARVILNKELRKKGVTQDDVKGFDEVETVNLLRSRTFGIFSLMNYYNTK